VVNCHWTVDTCSKNHRRVMKAQHGRFLEITTSFLYEVKFYYVLQDIGKKSVHTIFVLLGLGTLFTSNLLKYFCWGGWKLFFYFYFLKKQKYLKMCVLTAWALAIGCGFVPFALLSQPHVSLGEASEGTCTIEDR